MIFIHALFNHFVFTLREMIQIAISKKKPRLAIRFFFMRNRVSFGLFKKSSPESKYSNETINLLEKQGFAELPPLPEEDYNRMIADVLVNSKNIIGHPCQSLEEYASTLHMKNIQRAIVLQGTGSESCALSKVAKFPLFLDLASTFLKLPVSSLMLEANVDFLVGNTDPNRYSGYDNALKYHRDIDSYRFLKVFIYLSNCFENNGHHEVYLQSHRFFPIALGPIRRYLSCEIEKHIPQSSLKKVVGKAGYTFAENTLSFHRGTEPKSGFRLMLNLIYMEDRFKEIYPAMFKAID